MDAKINRNGAAMKSLILTKKTDAEVQKLRGEIEERKSQLKNIISEIEENSNTRQVEHGKKNVRTNFK